VTRDAEVDATVRPYDPDDAAALWRCKRGFETHLGEGTGDESKRARYAGKLTDTYRDGYLAWVDRCVADEPGCLRVAVPADEGEHTTGTETGNATDTGTEPGPDAGAATVERGGTELLGYAFVLPESLAYVWDAAVLNELYVVPAARGSGVADDLLDAALDQARGQSLPLDRLVLDVDPANDRARAFYDRRGFEPWGEMVALSL
jgi:GNAT superfamily N-acetyltransferase